VQHGEVGFHLVALAPARDEPGLLVERRIDEMRDIAQPAEYLGAARAIEQIDGNDRGPLEPRRNAPRDADGLPAGKRREMPEGSVADQSGSAGDENLLQKSSISLTWSVSGCGAPS
jgi:hypothetical protein